MTLLFPSGGSGTEPWIQNMVAGNGSDGPSGVDGFPDNGRF